MELPGSKESNLMMVANAMAFKGSLIDPEVLRLQNARYNREKASVKALDTCLEEKNLEPVMALLLDESASRTQRKRAIGLLLPLNDLNCIDPIRNHCFKDTSLEQEVNMIVSQLLQKNFKKECPYCCEIIKAQAPKCMHCGAEV
jgi:hypothetical protein